MNDLIQQYNGCKRWVIHCLNYQNPKEESMMAMMGYVDNLMEMEILEEEILEYGRS